MGRTTDRDEKNKSCFWECQNTGKFRCVSVCTCTHACFETPQEIERDQDRVRKASHCNSALWLCCIGRRWGASGNHAHPAVFSSLISLPPCWEQHLVREHSHTRARLVTVVLSGVSPLQELIIRHSGRTISTLLSVHFHSKNHFAPTINEFKITHHLLSFLILILNVKVINSLALFMAGKKKWICFVLLKVRSLNAELSEQLKV